MSTIDYFAHAFGYGQYKKYHQNKVRSPYMPTYPPKYHKGKPSTYLRGSRVTVRHNRVKTMTPAAPSGAIRYSRGLSIGSRRSRTSFKEAVMNTIYPPLNFNSKWNFQMECQSGRVSAISIPVLTKPLRNPLINCMYKALTTDTSTVDPTMATLTLGNLINRVVIKNYVTNLRMYNSSEQTSRCRLVWYKPRVDMEETLNLESGGGIPSSPINLTMYASTFMVEPVANQLVNPVAGDGLKFDGVYSIPYVNTGQNFYINYDHAGNPVVMNYAIPTDPQTTGNNTANDVAWLDPSLTPSSGQVRTFTSQYYSVLKTEDFTLAPGNQYNTKLVIKNKRIMSSNAVLADTFYYKDSTVIGVLYVLGQVVFSDVTSNNTITTGSPQISVLREDTCTMGLVRKQLISRINVTNPYIKLVDTQQGIVNIQTDTVDNNHDFDR